MLGSLKATSSILTNLNKSYKVTDRAMERIASGNRINRAADDAAGLAISEKLLGQMNGLNMAAKNTQDGVSMLNVAEGALNETHSIVQKMRELAVQSANDTNTPQERNALNNQFQELVKEIDRIAGTTEFNTRTLLNGDYKDSPLRLHIGANSGQSIDVFLGDMSWQSILGSNSERTDLHLLTQESSDAMIGVMDRVLNTVSHERSKIGAYTNRLEHAYNVTMNTGENLTSAYTQIHDADIAKEMMTITQERIKQQAATSVMSMQMQSASNVLHLLR
ncbi:flagellin [Caryophanon latum]|uniref:Flagellin n=1 Tax=Caryophanon latum TaxID=33977 RepID=A0A1C0YPS6_9BACL|nr:flagellin [Caryophanon latum]OCS89174.1 flagellin [Caryophanon latum]